MKKEQIPYLRIGNKHFPALIDTIEPTEGGERYRISLHVIVDAKQGIELMI